MPDYLKAGVVIVHDDKRPRALSGITNLVVGATAGPGPRKNTNITISYNISNAFIIDDNEMLADDLTRDMLHWSFRRRVGGGYYPGIVDIEFNYSSRNPKHKITNTRPTGNLSTYEQDFSLVNAKVGGAGPEITRSKKRSRKTK